MDITFETVQTEGRKTVIDARMDGEVIGHAEVWDYSADQDYVFMNFLYLEKEWKEQIEYDEFAQAFYAYMKSLGHTELYLETEYMEDAEQMGFQVVERDNSGWYPKYYCRRIL